MKFRLAVQNHKVAWPTQRKFERQKWLELAQELCEDEADLSLSRVGLWVAETLEPIRKTIESLSVWGLPVTRRAQYLLSICNKDFATLNHAANSIPPDSKGQYILLTLEEAIHQSFQPEPFGSGKASDLIESAIDSAERCLDYPKIERRPTEDSREQLTSLIRAINYVSAYQFAEDCFHQALWGNWRVEDIDDKWLIFPSDLDTEKLWEASWRRFSELEGELAVSAHHMWNEDSSFRLAWQSNMGGVPAFKVEVHEDLVHVSFSGKATPSSAPHSLVREMIATQTYYNSLVEEPLPSLNGKNVLDLLRVSSLIGDIAEEILRQFPKEYEIATVDAITVFCPIVLENPLITALSHATGMGRKVVSTILKALTWTSRRSLWFHPLVKTDTRKGPGYMFALLPLIAPSIYRSVDYWLTNLGLPIERRGLLFEQQIAEVLLTTARREDIERDVTVAKSQKLESHDKASREEIDVLIRLHDLLVVGEAKCQTLPTTPTDNRNYLETLAQGAIQANRKAEWVRSNLEIVAEVLGVNIEKLSGQVQPIVITNHPFGAGFIFHNVPVLDLVLLRNYLARPYLSQGQLTSKGLSLYQKGTRFYNNPKEMADKFHEYAANPFFLKVYTDFLEPAWTNCPIRSDKPVLRFQYLNLNAVSASVTN